MAKQTATHYEHIEGMSEEFSKIPDEHLGGTERAELYFRWWTLRIELAIAQQLSVISQTLKELKERQ